MCVCAWNVYMHLCLMSVTVIYPRCNMIQISISNIYLTLSQKKIEKALSEDLLTEVTNLINESNFLIENIHEQKLTTEN